MIVVLTQNKAIINITNFSTISIEHDDERPSDEVMVVCDNHYILGYYKITDVKEVLNWIIDTMTTATSDKTTVIIMPTEGVLN